MTAAGNQVNIHLGRKSFTQFSTALAQALYRIYLVTAVPILDYV